MSAVNPNMNCGILVDEFIRMATAHLLSVKGTIITTANYLPTGTPGPSQVMWTGYKIPPSQPEEQEIGGLGERVLNSNYEAGKKRKQSVLFIEEEDFAESQSESIVYPNVLKADGTSTVNSGRTIQTNFKASINDARAVAEAYMGQNFESDQEWSNFISLIAAESSINQTEQAYVAAAILNRTRKRINGAKTVTQTINFPRAFEPVTGPASSRVWYLKGPTPFREESIFGSIKEILPGVNKNIINFTSDNDCLYIRCTNGIPQKDANGNFIPVPNRVYSYLLQLRAKSTSVVIGGTIFSE